MFAGDQGSVAREEESVASGLATVVGFAGVSGGGEPDLGAMAGLPFDDVVARDVGEEEVARADFRVLHPYRSFGPDKAGTEDLDFCVGRKERVERGLEADDLSDARVVVGILCFS